MNLEIPHIYQQLSFSSHLRSQRSLSNFHHRAWKRRKLKVKFTVHSNLNFNFSDSSSSFEHLFRSLISQFPSVNSLELIAPALGLVSGTAICLSQFQKNQKILNVLSRRKRKNNSVGDWILFTTPTPFNRFVVLRCPSITFEGSELLEDVTDRLVKEDRHFVRLNSGRIQVKEGDEVAEEEEKVVYQRVCVGTEDGGVLSLDWPANLDLVEERGLDTTLLIVPGTVQGSLEIEIKIFVIECLRRGCFPVVLNPRGCAGSPITTSRESLSSWREVPNSYPNWLFARSLGFRKLFTAADSDDVATAVQYINMARPWTTLMAIGWGYGANMLTKYLAEVGEKTPLTAATCIDNPFDLDEATQSSPYHISLDQKLTSGLIDILRSNKELFQGRTKSFDVKKALSATSVRDFEKAISMVSYGFEEIEDFYAKSSSREMVGKVKIPLLFIQNDNGTVPLFSTPRSLIAENPFTSLLLCSYLPSSEATSCRSTISWCQHVTLEWFAAVELALLKGRHPLLKDVDVTINPAKGLALVERSSDENVRMNKLISLPNLSAFDEKSLSHLKDISERDSTTNLHSRFKNELKVDVQPEINGLQMEIKNSLEQSGDVDAELAEDEVANPVDGERGQVLQTAQIVMNMLDVTMNDTLTEEQKKKVLTAVGRGETLMKALQDAVPEDVREKLTTAVSRILHSQESNLKLDKFLSLGQIPDVASRWKSKVREKTAGKLITNGGSDDPQTSGQKAVDDLTDVSNKFPPSKSESATVPESEVQASENAQKTFESKQSQPHENHAIDIPDSDKKGVNDLGNNEENVDFSKEKTALPSDYKDNGLETVAKPEGAGVASGTVIEHYKEHDGGRNQIATGEDITNKQNEMKTVESSVNQARTTSSSQTEDKSPIPASPAEIQMTETEGGDIVKREERNAQQPVSAQDGSNPSCSVSLALDALTGIDDSTQVAVNSVFNVIEDMITKLEDGRDNEDEDKDRDNRNEAKTHPYRCKSEDSGNIQDRKVSLVNEKPFTNGNKLKVLDEKRNDNDVPSYSSDDISSSIQLNSEEISTKDTVSFGGKNTDSFQEGNPKSYMKKENGGKEHLNGGKISSEQSVTHINGISKHGPIYITTNLYGDPLYKEYLQKYLISMMRTTKSLDLDTTRALFLDYFPEEGQWKLLEQREENNDIIEDIESQARISSKAEAHLNSDVEGTNDVIEPSYKIFDSEQQQEQVEQAEKTNSSNHVQMGYDTEDSGLFVKNIVLNTLKVEVERRLSAADMEELEPKLARDLELIADAVCLSVRQEEEHMPINGKDHAVEKFGTLNGENIMEAISLAFNDTGYLKRILPLGVVVGSSLASLRNFFAVGTVNSDTHSEDLHSDQVSIPRDIDHAQPTVYLADEMLHEETCQKHGLDNSVGKDNDGKPKSNSSNSKTVMVGAVTAALGASALLVDRQNAESNGTLSKPFKDKNSHDKNVEEMSESTQNNIVTSLAEKAMSVAGPVVPTKKDGEVDQERLVTMLAELGQRGGILKLVGKMALLWGGIRGAMSLIDKLISVLHIAERPLFQRIFGFVCMVVVLWSPIVVPLLPTLMLSWGTQNSPKIAELACIVGLYVAIMLMVSLWGKRICAYDDPLEQYGLDVNSPLKVQNFVTGLAGGVMLVLSINSINILCGFVQPSWPTYLPSSHVDTVAWIKLCGRVLIVAVRALVTATSVAVVEELLFRSWLPNEIAADHGYHWAIIISGLAFSLSQRSPWSIPGLWLLSLALAGARQRSQGSLFLPIGLRAGILICSFFLQIGGFLTYQPSFPIWLSGRPFQPFSGVLGLAFSLSLAIMLYPSQHLHGEKISRAIRE